MKTLRKSMEHSIPLLRLCRKQMWMERPSELHWVPLFTFVFSKSEFTAFVTVLHCCTSFAVGTLAKAVNPDCSKFGQIGPTFVLHSQRHLPWSSSWWWCLRTQITERKIAARLWLNWTNISTAEVLQMSWKCFIYVLPLIWWLQSLIVRHSSPRHSS